MPTRAAIGGPHAPNLIAEMATGHVKEYAQMRSGRQHRDLAHGQPLTNAVADTAEMFRKTGDFKQVP
jgi:hypothetical protein